MSIDCTPEKTLKQKTTEDRLLGAKLDSYFKNPEKFRANNPELAKEFDANPDVQKSYKDARPIVQEYEDSNPLNKVGAQIYRESVPTFAQNMYENLGNIRQMTGKEAYQKFSVPWIDNIGVMENYSPDAYLKARLIRGQGAAIESFMKYGTFDFNDPLKKRTGKGLIEILEQIPMDQKEDFSSYLAARTITEDVKFNRDEAKSKFDEYNSTNVGKKDSSKYKKLEDIKNKTEKQLESAKYRLMEDAKEQAEKQYPEFKKYASEVDTLSSSLLKYMRDGEMISPESYDIMSEKRTMYAPLNRVMEEGMRKAGVKTTNGISATDAIKMRTNVLSDYTIYDPINSLMANINTTLYNAEVNRMKSILVRDGKEKGFVKEVKTPKIAEEDIKAKLAEFGLDKDLEGVPSQVLDMLMHNPITEPGQNVFSVWDQGKRKSYEVPPDLYEALKNATNRKEYGSFFNMAASFAQTLRTGITQMPGFQAKAIIRDVPEAIIKSQYGITPVDIVKGVMSAYNMDEHYHTFMRTGGGQASGRTVNRKYQLKLVDNLRKDQKSGKFKTFMDENTRGLKKLWDMYKHASEALELGPRIAENRKALEKGARPDVAALRGRDVTLDFGRYGNAMQMLNRVVPFANAHIQGLNNFGRTMFPMKDGKLDYESMLKPWTLTAAWVGFPSMVNAVYNNMNPKYRELSDAEKNTYWHVDYGGGFIRIPKPMEFSQFIGNGIEEVVRHQYDKDRSYFNNFIKEVIFDQTGSRLAIPTLVAPMMEQWANKTLYFNSPVVSPWLMDVRPSERTNPRTTQLMQKMTKGLADVFGVEMSPAVVQNYIERWTGTLGSDLLKLADYGSEKLGIVEDPVKTDLRGWWSAFFARYPVENPATLQKFFDLHQSNNEAGKTVKKMIKEGRNEEALRYKKTYEKISSKPAYKAILRIKQYMRSVKNNKELGEGQKDALLEQASLQLVTIAQDYIDKYTLPASK